MSLLVSEIMDGIAKTDAKERNNMVGYTENLHKEVTGELQKFNDNIIASLSNLMVELEGDLHREYPNLISKAIYRLPFEICSSPLREYKFDKSLNNGYMVSIVPRGKAASLIMSVGTLTSGNAKKCIKVCVKPFWGVSKDGCNIVVRNSDDMKKLINFTNKVSIALHQVVIEFYKAKLNIGNRDVCAEYTLREKLTTLFHSLEDC